MLLQSKPACRKVHSVEIFLSLLGVVHLDTGEVMGHLAEANRRPELISGSSELLVLSF